jgi:hypothetical protein
MYRRVACILLPFVCAAALGGCTWLSQPGAGTVNADEVARLAEAHRTVEELVKALNSFTNELLSKVESGADTKAGLAEAQALLDARKEGLTARIRAFKQGAQYPAARGRLLEAEVDNTDRVHRLQLKYADAAAQDAELKARLERLINDYDALYR